MRNKAIVLKFNDKLEREEKEFTEVDISDKQDPPRKVLPYFLWRKYISKNYLLTIIIM